MAETDWSPVISHRQAAALIAARARALPVLPISLDLELTKVEVSLNPEGVFQAGSNLLDWDQVERVAASENGCFRIVAGIAEEIRVFSEPSRLLLRLLATDDAPALLLSGFTMHRFKGTSPWRAAREMAGTLGPIRGRALDTATGLGYTAVALAEAGAEVTTVEIEPAVAAIARQNPWSRPLFDNPRIERLMEDTSEVIARFPDGHFRAVLHDPPSVSLAGDLYSGEFYRGLHRVLAPGGRLFHYIGDPKSDLGARTTEGVVKRLKEAGFRKVLPKPRAYGVLAIQ